MKFDPMYIWHNLYVTEIYADGSSISIQDNTFIFYKNGKNSTITSSSLIIDEDQILTVSELIYKKIYKNFWASDDNTKKLGGFKVTKLKNENILLTWEPEIYEKATELLAQRIILEVERMKALSFYE